MACLGFDRSSYVEVLNDDRMHTICSVAMPPHRPLQRGALTLHVPWLMSELRAGRVVCRSSLPDGLPADAAASVRLALAADAEGDRPRAGALMHAADSGQPHRVPVLYLATWERGEGGNTQLTRLDALLRERRDAYFGLLRDWLKSEGESPLQTQRILRAALDLRPSAWKLRLALAGFSVLLLILAVALINNTIRLAIYSKRFLIRTMHLVGATQWFIKKPFLGQSLWQGIVGAMLAIGLLVGLLQLTDHYKIGRASCRERVSSPV